MDDRRKRLLYRSTHRGMKETDTLLGGYASACLASMPEDDLSEFELLMDESDNDLMNWILEREPLPDGPLMNVLENIIAYKKTL